jgi:hypothetical protein
MVISGPTRSGKTELTKQIIKQAHEVIYPVPESVLWFYTAWQKSYEDMVNIVTFHEGPPDVATLKENTGKRRLIILDDMMSIIPNEQLNMLFTVASHHYNMAVIHIAQNAFFKGMRTARINCHYLILMKNPADKLQIMNIGRQIYPTRQKFFMECFEDATKKPFGYLVVDTEPTTDDSLRLRTNIFIHPIVYK